MVKFAHLLVLSALIVWLAGSGCVENNTSEVGKAGIGQNTVEKWNGVPAGDLGMGLTQVEIQKQDSNITNLEELLNNSSLEDIEIEEL